VGACPDFGYWMRSGIDPIGGTGVGRTEQVLAEFQRLGIKPTMFGLEYSYDWLDSMPEIAESAAMFNRVSVELSEK
jgi:hypothetical protein